MPRVKTLKEHYAQTDFQAWLNNQKKLQKITCADIGKELGKTPQSISLKIKNMNFTYRELVKIFNMFGCDPERISYFMTGNR